MKLVHDSLSKPQRALRAYMNSETSPPGFRGNPLVEEEGCSRREHDLTHYHLSRYMYARATLERAFIDLFEGQMEGRMLRSITLPRISGRGLRRRIENIERMKRNGMGSPLYLDRAIDALKEATPELVTSARRLESEVIGMYLHNLDLLVFDMIAPGEDQKFIERVRKYGGEVVTCLELLGLTDELVLKGMTDAEQKVVLEVLRGLLFSELAAASPDEKEGDKNLGRIRFTRQHNQGWSFLRRHLFEGVSEQMILDALRLSGIREIYQPYVDRLFKLHNRYGLLATFTYRGAEFTLEGSPFAEKPLGAPIGNFELVVYPRDPALVAALTALRDPSFEHADGAIALAALRIGKGGLLLEEIQSDVPTLLGKRGVQAADCLIGLLQEWQQISLLAARTFATRYGFDRFYASTPWRIFTRYHGVMHPDKVRLYFDGMERLGGKLVYDEEPRLCIQPQYYYRFSANG